MTESPSEAYNTTRNSHDIFASRVSITRITRAYCLQIYISMHREKQHAYLQFRWNALRSMHKIPINCFVLVNDACILQPVCNSSSGSSSDRALQCHAKWIPDARSVAIYVVVVVVSACLVNLCITFSGVHRDAIHPKQKREAHFNLSTLLAVSLTLLRSRSSVVRTQNCAH